MRSFVSSKDDSALKRAFLPYPLLSDSGGRVGEVYGGYDEANGFDIHCRFIIDPDFVIRASEVLTAEFGRNVSELIRQIQAFQQVVKTGEVPPFRRATW